MLKKGVLVKNINSLPRTHFIITEGKNNYQDKMHTKTSNFPTQAQQAACYQLPLTSTNFQHQFFIFSFSKVGVNIFHEASTKTNSGVAEVQNFSLLNFYQKERAGHILSILIFFLRFHLLIHVTQYDTCCCVEDANLFLPLNSLWFVRDSHIKTL